MSMINISNHHLHISDSPSSTSLVADKYYRAVKEQLISEGIYSDSDRIPSSLVNFIIVNWVQAYGAGYKDMQIALTGFDS